MKILLILTTLALSITAAIAQQGVIIYQNSPSPDTLHPIFGPGYALYDFDDNNTQDLWIGIPSDPWYCVKAFSVNEWQFYYKDWFNQFVNPGDTLLAIPEWCWRNAPQNPWDNGIGKDGPTIILDPGEDVDSVFIGIRKLAEGGFCYGWLLFSAKIDSAPYPENNTTIIIHDYAFCTDSKYPFYVGQIGFTAIEETSKDDIFATVHPNPTTGQITITGENLQQAELFNMLGQQLLSVRDSGNELQISMSALPAGIYFVAVTNEEGRRCVQKVVKE